MIGASKNKKSIIRFSISKLISTDEDADSSIHIVPFNVSYAISIHKAQGLEFDSVKVIITDEVEELITHNIFYTAITRSKNNLKIYWSAEVQNKILKSFKNKNINKDISVFLSKHEFKKSN